MPEFYMILARKIIKIPEFLWYLPEKFTKSRILHDFCPKNARILRNDCPKNIFSRILGGTCPSAPRLLRLCKSWHHRKHCCIYYYHYHCSIIVHSTDAVDKGDTFVVVSKFLSFKRHCFSIRVIECSVGLDWHLWWHGKESRDSWVILEWFNCLLPLQ